MLAVLAALTLTLTAAPQTTLDMTDPFTACAGRALRGDFGELAEWQAEGYKRGLAQHVTASRRVWLTGYYGTEGSGRTDAAGRRCTMRTCAANPPTRQGWWVWTPHGIRQARDTGARSNDRIARAKGCALWVDYWYATPGRCPFGGSTRTNGAVIR